MSAQVIVVDDEAAIREAVQQWLELSGFRVHSCATAQAALAHRRAQFDEAVVHGIDQQDMGADHQADQIDHAESTGDHGNDGRATRTDDLGRKRTLSAGAHQLARCVQG